MSQLYARGLLVTPLDEDGRPMFTVDGNEVTFHREGWYRLTAGELEHDLNVFAGAKVQHVSFTEDAQAVKQSDDLHLLLTDLVDEEPCRLDHDGDCQEHSWFPGLADRPCPQERLRDHLGLDRQVNDDLDEEPSAEAMASVHHSIALAWLQEGTLDLPALAAAIGMDVDQGVLRVRPTEQAKITGPHGSWDTRTVEIPSHTRTQVVGPDGDLPAVWVQHYAGHNARVKVDRSHGLRGAVNTEVWVYGDSQAKPTRDDTVGRLRREITDLEAMVETHRDATSWFQKEAGDLENANRVLREATQAQAGVIKGTNRAITEVRAELTAALRRIETLNGDRARMLADNQKLTERLMRERQGHSAELESARHRLETVGRHLHVQANRLHVTAQGMTQHDRTGTEFYVMCDVLAKLREAASDVCRVPYDESEKLDPNEGVPWSLREWALRARQTMDYQARWLDEAFEIREGTPEDRAQVGRTLVNTIKVMREVVADYPEDLDAVQAEQATRNADDEAVRRLAHAMTEVANSLESIWGRLRRCAQGDAHVIPYAVDKLRRTVKEWTTEEQRRPWAKDVSDEPDAWDEPMINPITGEGLENVGAVRGPIEFKVGDWSQRRADETTFSDGGVEDTTSLGIPSGQYFKALDAFGRLPEVWVMHQAGRDIEVTVERQGSGEGSIVSLKLHGLDVMHNFHQRMTIADDMVARRERALNSALDAGQKLARTMQAAATGIEAAYPPGKAPTIIRNIVQHLRADSAPWTSDALRAHEGEPVATDPENTSADPKDTSAAQAPHGARGALEASEQVKDAMRNAQELLRELRGSVPPSLIPWARSAGIRLAEALKLVES